MPRKHSTAAVVATGEFHINEPGPYHVGDVITFGGTDGGTNITVATYQPFGTAPAGSFGAVFAKKIAVGESVTLAAAGDSYAWLDDDQDMSDGFVAAVLFTVA